ncbi:MAG: YdcF family protein [Firmicutes bacterium]|nr:YdcF family protein [Bacillota bacterium]
MAEKTIIKTEEAAAIELEKEKARTVRANKKSKKRRKGAGPLSGLFAALAFVFLIYGIAVVFILGTGHWFNFIWIIGAVVLLILSFLFSNHSKLPGIIKAILGLAILACVVNFGMFTFKAASAASAKPDQDAKWIVVLGAKVNGTSPSVEFQARLEKTVSFVSSADLSKMASSKSEPVQLAKIITTGGKGTDEGAAEGDVAARVLTSLGISQDRIIVENTSTSTQENLRFAKELIIANGGTVYDPVLVVSSGFHLYRAERLAWAEGYENISGLGSTGLAVLIPHYYVREYAAYIKEASLGHFSR